jgi:hypothetical protein
MLSRTAYGLSQTRMYVLLGILQQYLLSVCQHMQYVNYVSQHDKCCGLGILVYNTHNKTRDDSVTA